MRRHRTFALAVVAAAVLRAVVMLAYRPALLFPDSIRYLKAAHGFYLSTARPGGYSMVLWPLARVTDSLVPVTLAQHVLVLALAVLAYVFLLRRGLPRWGATLALLPLLFDPLQLALEQFVLSDVLFEVLLVVACLALLWRRRPGIRTVVAVGAMVGCAGLVRGAGTFLVVVFLVAVICLRLPWVRVVAFLVAAAVPLGVYSFAYQQEHGQFAVVTSGPRFLYARLAPFVYCHNDDLPRFERELCPPERVGHRPDTNFYMWNGEKGAAYTIPPSHGMTQLQILKDFDKRVIRAEPRVYAKAVLKDAAVGFAPTRNYQVAGYPSSYWLFSDHYWSLDPFGARKVRWEAEYDVGYNPTAASFLKAYRQVIYTPGPLLAALLLVGAVASAGFGRARLSGDRVAVGLLIGSCAMPLLTGAAVGGFSWRYQLTQVPLLPLGGVLGMAALLRGRAPGAPAPAPPLRLLERGAVLLARAPMPRGWRPVADRSVENGRLQLLLAPVAALVVALVVGVLALASGWAAADTAVWGGGAVGLVALTMLLVGRSRATAVDDAGGRHPV